MNLVEACHRGRQFGTMALLAGVFLLMPTSQEADPRYRAHGELTDALRRVVRAHSDLATMESLGRTLEGRDIWVVEIANRAGTPVEERPGLLIAANLEGDHLVGSELAVATVEYLLNNYETDADVKERLDNHVVYVFPRVNPDAAELMFDNVMSGRRTNTRPYDGDNDGRVDEDGPEDLNGDGQITVMRVADPSGPYMVHPDEPRLLKEAEAHEGESGAYSLYWEGTDNDGDGFFNEDGPGGVDLNRNFQHEYPYHEADAGPHMVSEVESRALMDFVLSHRNIAMVLTFGGSDNLVSPPASSGSLAAASGLDLISFADASYDAADTVGTFPISLPGRSFGPGFGYFRRRAAPAPRPLEGRQPNRTVHRSDVEYFSTVSEHYREITGIERLSATRAPKGAFFEYAYYQFGVPGFSTLGWGIPESDAPSEDGGDRPAAQREGARATAAPQGAAGARGRMRPGAGQSSGSGGGVDQRLLEWMDAAALDGFVDWTEYQHPELGAVEIGGFKPYFVSNPPASALPEIGESHARFAVYLMSLFADVSVADIEVTNHGGGVFEIKAEIENSGFLPTALLQGVAARAVAPTMVQLEVAPEDILTGDAKTSFFQSLEGSGSRESYTWVVRGREGAQVTLTVRSQKGGSDTATITLR